MVPMRQAARSGIINYAWLKAKYDYKCAIKKAVNDFESANADEISDHLLNKDNNKFWRAWNNKYKNALDAAVSVGGSSDPMAIAASFRDYYSSIYVYSAADFNAFVEFNDLFTKLNNCNNNNDAMPHIDVELIEMCVKHLKSGKAAGADRLVAEHIVHAAPSLIMHLKLLFFLYFCRIVMYLMPLVLELLFLLSKISLATLVYLIITGQLF